MSPVAQPWLVIVIWLLEIVLESKVFAVSYSVVNPVTTKSLTTAKYFALKSVKSENKLSAPWSDFCI